VAYVLDEDGTFATRCNKGAVDLERLEGKDAETIRMLIQRHYDYTRSVVAWRILSSWDEWAPKFVAVVPTEYRQVLARLHLDSEASRLAAV
jgi:glutamate synthase (ferredoxin)